MRQETDSVAVRYASALIAGLVQAGVRHICLCPGSRSTPLALAAASDERVRLWVHVDERSAAFFALGLAKESGHPVAVITTSGTAAANLYPAVIEARYGRQPLLLLTADRPHELREVGAPQAIDQIHLFGGHVKEFIEMQLPEEGAASLRYAESIGRRAAATATRSPAGPVHLNLPFREPFLTPAPEGAVSVESLYRDDGAVLSGRRQLDEGVAASLLDELMGRRGLLVCGPQEVPQLPESIAALAAALDWPILADPLSGLRCGPHDRSRVIATYDALLRSPRWFEGMAPEVILRFGPMPTSKAYRLYTEHHREALQIVVDEGGEWLDPTLQSGRMVHADPVALCQLWTSLLAERSAQQEWRAQSSGWSKRWRQADRGAATAMHEAIASFDGRFEGAIFPQLLDVLPSEARLVIGNSMPIRDADLFLTGREAPLRILGNRGANGIDGLLSTALGVAAGADRPTLLVVGDLSFYHDMNGLLAAKENGLDLTVLLVHNDGGGIFSFLPQAEVVDDFERLFGTPHGLNFGPIIEQFGGRFTRADSTAEMATAIRTALREGGLQVVEWRTDRAEGVALHRRMWQPAAAVAERIAQAALEGV